MYTQILRTEQRNINTVYEQGRFIHSPNFFCPNLYPFTFAKCCHCQTFLLYGMVSFSTMHSQPVHNLVQYTLQLSIPYIIVMPTTHCSFLVKLQYFFNSITIYVLYITKYVLYSKNLLWPWAHGHTGCSVSTGHVIGKVLYAI